MRYTLQVSEVVTGVVTFVVMTSLMRNLYELGPILILGAVAVLGLFLIVHGLLTGIEAAVAAGTDSSTNTRPD